MSPSREAAGSTLSEAGDAARRWLHEQGQAILDEQIELASIAAPPFQEQARTELIASKLSTAGIPFEVDEIGNLTAWYPPGKRRSEAPPAVVAAHVDTVFGPDTVVTVRREGHRFSGPGITDNARGLAVCLHVLRALERADVQPLTPLAFAFTVGEEGEGDLRGVKHLFREAGALRSAALFIAVDGAGLRRIVHGAVGSQRSRLTVHGPGGHSWTDWGRVNPAVVVGDFVARITSIPLAESPRTTLTVARIGGGTSINSIPADAWVELDLRSEDAHQIERISARLRATLDASLDAERGRGEGLLEVNVEIIGQRPAGLLAEDHQLVRAATAATQAVGAEPKYAISSTDANVPLSLGIPAIAIGAGGRSGDTHTTHEWFEDTDGAMGGIRLLFLLGAVAGF